MFRYVFCILLSLLFAISSSSSQIPEKAHGKLYYVTLNLYEGDRIIGKPKFVIEDGSAATIMRATQDGYSLKTQIRMAGTEQRKTVTLSNLLYLAKSDAWLKAAEPVLTLSLENMVSTTFPGIGRGQIRIEATVSDNFTGKFASTQSFGKNKCTAKKLASWSRATTMPVNASMIKVQSDTTETGGCCSPCSGMTCCSSGPMCCSDSHVCPRGGSCCN
ncbi:hypothetical protein [Sphingomonas sp. HMP6]|uniref:hypothetical protein n=1 Tax=Sphingomonas sp. HMP6 TaxID=1517551 RepID=UPI00159681F8|nr:hypothetical protein [Sphingomonas sp. HMP6]